jgi:hypothetical protein
MEHIRLTWPEDVRIARVNEPCPVASEGRQHDIENIAHHVVKVAAPLDGAVDPVQAFEGPHLRLLFLETLVLEGCRGVIRSKIDQKLISLRWEPGPATGRGNHPALGIDPDGNDKSAAGADTAVDVRNDLPA